MSTWDDSDSSEDDSEKEQANVAFMTGTELLESKSDSESESENIFSQLTFTELEIALVQMF